MPNHEKYQRVPSNYIEIAAAGAVVAADTDCPEHTRGLLIGTGGSIVVTLAGHTVTLAVGQGLLLGEFDSITAVGSTVTGIWAAI